jgi:hypothetical protein
VLGWKYVAEDWDNVIFKSGPSEMGVLEEFEIAAVSSRNKKTAEEYAAKFNIRRGSRRWRAGQWCAGVKPRTSCRLFFRLRL